MDSSPKCGSEASSGNKTCPACGRAREKRSLYAKAFRAKRTVYLFR